MWYGQKDVMNDICDVWDDHVLVIGITTCMSMSMTTGRSHRSCLYLLYDLRVIEERHVNYFTLLLNALAIEVEVIVGVTTSWRHNDGDHDDGDHGVKPVTRWSWSPEDEDQRSYMILAISCHYYIIACDVYYVYASCLLRTTVVNKMIPYKISRSVLP